jgi:hypothetical protein
MNGSSRKTFNSLRVWFLILLFFLTKKNYPTHTLATSVFSIVFSKKKTSIRFQPVAARKRARSRNGYSSCEAPRRACLLLHACTHTWRQPVAPLALRSQDVARSTRWHAARRDPCPAPSNLVPPTSPFPWYDEADTTADMMRRRIGIETGERYRREIGKQWRRWQAGTGAPGCAR